MANIVKGEKATQWPKHRMPYHRSMKNGFACPMHLFEACKEKPCLLMAFQELDQK